MLESSANPGNPSALATHLCHLAGFRLPLHLRTAVDVDPCPPVLAEALLFLTGRDGCEDHDVRKAELVRLLDVGNEPGS